MSTGKAILASIRQQLNLGDYRKTHWEGTFDEYLDIVREHPDVTRTAYQRLYDMIMSHGVEDIYENKEKVARYKFFRDYAAKHDDGIFGLDRAKGAGVLMVVPGDPDGPMLDLIREHAGVHVHPSMPVADVEAVCDELGVPREKGWGSGKLVLESVTGLEPGAEVAYAVHAPAGSLDWIPATRVAPPPSQVALELTVMVEAPPK